MRSHLPLILLVSILFLSPTSLFAEGDKTAALPSAQVSLTGTWDFKTSQHKEYGICEVGKPYSGKLTITQKDNHLTLVFLSGPIVCSPPAACKYQGKLKGDQAYFHNTTVAEGDRGSLLNSIHLNINSNLSAAGNVRSIKQFIGGSMCEWTHQIQLTRKKGKGTP